MTEDNTLAIFGHEPALSDELGLALVGLEDKILAAAHANVSNEIGVLEDNPQWTETEIMAMVSVEALKQINTLDLASVLLRGKYLKIIEDRNLVSRHPGGYHTLEEMARDQGISASELSQTRDLCNIIFPYLTNELGMVLPLVWENVGKSNFREMTPVLKRIITGDDTGIGSVSESATRILEDIEDTFRHAGDNETADNFEAIRQEAVTWLVEEVGPQPNREVRRAIRPERTPNAEVYTIGTDDDTIVIAAELTPEQWENFMRRWGHYADAMPLILDENMSSDQKITQGKLVRPFHRIFDFFGLEEEDE